MGRLATVVIALLTAAFAASGVVAAERAPASRKPTDWSALGQLPAINGVWEGVGGGMITPRDAPMTAEAAAKYAKYRADQASDRIQDYQTANCIPPGILINMAMPYPIEILVTPGKVTMILEAFTQVRHIFTDGRPLPADPDLTYNGASVGRWEGDTLVVETIGFLPEVEPAWGLGHGDTMKIVERYRLVGPDKLEVRYTMTDPAVLTAPWTTTRTFERRPTWALREYVCSQNNRHTFDASGKATVRLAP
jgi:hypothetical protein